MTSVELWMASWLLDVSIKAALLALAAWVGMAACRVGSSSVRHRVWFLVLVGMLLLPALVNLAPRVPLPGWLFPTGQLAAEKGETAGGPPQTIVQQPAADGLNVPAPSGPSPALGFGEPGPAGDARDAVTHGMAKQEPREAAAIPLPALPASAAHSVAPRTAGSNRLALAVIGVYLAGVALLMVRLLIGMVQASRLVRRASQVDLPRSATWQPTGTRIVESNEVRVPMTVGYWLPIVVLPADWKMWSDSSLTMVLAHETEHVRRRDTWIALLATLNCAVYWFHPVAWFIRRRLADLAEQVCDDAVIRATGSRNEYAQNLLDIASRLSAGSGRVRPVRPVGVAMARKANVVERIEAILDNDRPLSRRIGAAGALLLVGIMAPVVFLAAGLRPTTPTVAAEPAATTVKSEKVADSKLPATSLQGRVVMAGDGSPVAGAEVRLLIWRPMGLGRKTAGLDEKTATTNEKGQFEFKELGKGRFILAAYYQNLASRTKLHIGYEAKAGEDSIVLKLREAPSLKVKVVARADAKPIKGATVSLVWTDVKRDHLTDADGEVLINGLTSEVWTIEACAKGFAVDKQALNLSGTGTASVTAKLAPGVELFGVVCDEAGKGLPEVGIDVFPSGLNGGQIAYMKTDADGKYRFEYLPIAGFTLMLQKEGYAESRPDVAITAAAGGRQELNLTLHRRPDGGSVRGTVVDKDGKPVAGASVVNRGGSSDELHKTMTDAQGRYRLDDVYHNLFIKAKRFAPQHLEFKPGDREHPAEVNVTLSAGHRIRGRVVNEQGQALAGVQVVYAHGNGFPGIDFGGGTTTDAEGHFEFDSLPAEPPFALNKEGYSPMEDVKLPLDGEKEVVVAMRGAGVIRGRVVDDKTGTPLSTFVVHARGIRGEKFATRDGTFRIGELVRDATLQVMVEADGYDRSVVRRVVAVADSEAKPVEFRLAPIDASSLLTIAGRLVDERARPRAGAELGLIVASKRPFPRDQFPFTWPMIHSGQIESKDLVLQFLTAITDSDGRFRFTQVRAGGDIELAYWGEGVSQNRREHIERLSPKEQGDLTIISKTPGVVRGAIDRKAYPAVSEIMLSAYLDSEVGRASLGNNSYEMRNVPAGRYELQVYGPIRPSGRGDGKNAWDVLKRIPIEVKSGVTLTVDLGPDPDASQPAKGGETESGRLISGVGVNSNSGLVGEITLDEKNATKPEKPGTSDGGSKSSTDAANAKVSGKVIDESGRAVDGAEVWLRVQVHFQYAKADSQGQFSLEVPSAWLAELQRPRMPFTVWAYAAGHQLCIGKAVLSTSASNLTIRLAPASDTSFVVSDPEGRPCAGALVEPYYIRNSRGNNEFPPDELLARVGARTDKEGRVKLPAAPPDLLYQVRVHAKGFGTQLQPTAPASAIVGTAIRLRPVGKIEGRVVGGPPELVRGIRLVFTSENNVRPRPFPLKKWPIEGYADVKTDKQGRFGVPAIAVGEAWIEHYNVDEKQPLLLKLPESVSVQADRTTSLEIPLVPSVIVRGSVRVKDTGKPVSGAQIHIRYGVGYRQGAMAVSDAQGNYTARVLPGRIGLQVIFMPEAYVLLSEGPARVRNDRSLEVPEDAKEFDLPSIEAGLAGPTKVSVNKSPSTYQIERREPVPGFNSENFPPRIWNESHALSVKNVSAEPQPLTEES